MEISKLSWKLLWKYTHKRSKTKRKSIQIRRKIRTKIQSKNWLTLLAHVHQFFIQVSCPVSDYLNIWRLHFNSTIQPGTVKKCNLTLYVFHRFQLFCHCNLYCQNSWNG